MVFYEGSPGGQTKVSIYSLGSDKVLSNFNAKITPQGDRSLVIGSLSENQTEAINQINNGLKMLVEGAIQGAK